jgi:hypothetical protein
VLGGPGRSDRGALVASTSLRMSRSGSLRAGHDITAATARRQPRSEPLTTHDRTMGCGQAGQDRDRRRRDVRRFGGCREHSRLRQVQTTVPSATSIRPRVPRPAADSRWRAGSVWTSTTPPKSRADYQLALDLYDTGIADAMYLAGLIADDAKMTQKDLQRWIEGASGGG